MPREKEKSVLKSAEYDIQGNSVRAFYDAQGKLVFVLDLTTDKIKPNVLLVMASRGNRKWDDVLVNDYGMDLELVRPKKDNKYQKLDVEYDGLAVYDNLIRAYQNDENLEGALRDLHDFRIVSVRRSAAERLAAANAVADNARETIERTGDTIIELQAKIKAVRGKISTLRRGVGREPTKQSAAKILKAEAQLDALTGKLTRAQRRLENANKRLLNAEDDIAAAQAVLDLVPDNARGKKNRSVGAPTVAPVVTKSDDVVDDDDNLDDDDDNAQDEGFDLDDDDNNVKPLFDTDPNIMDEKIAFKPISFDEPKSEPVNSGDVYDTDFDNDNADKDAESGGEDNSQENQESEPVVSFEPPKAIMDIVRVPDEYQTDNTELDGVFAQSADDDIVYEPVQEIVREPDENPVVQPGADVVDMAPGTTTDVDSVVMPDEKSERVENVEQSNAQNVDAAPGLVGMTNTENMVRPAMPGGNNQSVVTDVPRQSGQPGNRPGVLYYVLLLVLVALSVFTLWLYQRSNVSPDAVPELIAAQVEPDAQPVEQDLSGDNPFIASGDVLVNVAVETVPDNVMPVDDVVETDVVIPEAAPVDVVDEPDAVVEPEPDVVVPSEPEPPVVDKPEYTVTASNVFVGGDSSEIVGGNLCSGDVAPDANGCCPGETYSIVDGQNVCCPDDGTDCFPPMF